MRRAIYYVLCAKCNGVDNIDNFHLEERKGYIDDELNIGYSCLYENGERMGYWNATDLNSGFIMATAKSRKECIEKAIKNIPFLNEKVMNDESFGKMVDIYNSLKIEKRTDLSEIVEKVRALVLEAMDECEETNQDIIDDVMLCDEKKLKEYADIYLKKA